MIAYIELIEQCTYMNGIPEPDYVRIKIDDYAGTEQELVNELKGLIPVVMPANTQYVIQKHYCKHDDKQPCVVELTEKVI